MDDTAEIIKSRRKFIRDCTMLQNLGWKMKRTKTHQFGIECSPGWSHELVQNSFYSLKNLKAGYVSFISYGHFHSSSYLKNWLQSNIHEYLHFLFQSQSQFQEGWLELEDDNDNDQFPCKVLTVSLIIADTREKLASCALPT